MTAKALDLGFTVCIVGEDSSRADPDFLTRVVAVAERAGARRFRFADTMGLLDPFAAREVFRTLKSSCSLELEIHAHNDLGLATANTLAAVLGGATHVNTTANGLGKHSGTASICWAYRQLGIAINNRQAKAVLPLLREHAARTKCQPNTWELVRFLKETADLGPEMELAGICGFY